MKYITASEVLRSIDNDLLSLKGNVFSVVFLDVLWLIIILGSRSYNFFQR